MRWEPKIVGHGVATIEDILFNENNIRVHTKMQHSTLDAMMREVGIIETIKINRRSSKEWPERQRGVETLVDGHERVTEAHKAGMNELPVTFVDLTPQEERYALLMLDSSTRQAEWDEETEKRLLAEVEAATEEMAAVFDLVAEKYQEIPEHIPEHSEDQSGEIDHVFDVIVDVRSKEDQVKLLEDLDGEGFDCEPLEIPRGRVEGDG